MRRYAIPIPDRSEAPQDVKPSSAPHPVFKRMIDEVEPDIIIEIGACQGGSTVHMASLTEATIISVDTWATLGGRDCFDWFMRHVGCRKLGKQVVALQMKSIAAAHLAAKHDLKPRLVYIDGGHDEVNVTIDITNWLSLIPSGGILFGHDYNLGGVKNAVTKCLGEVDTDGVFWIWRVK